MRRVNRVLRKLKELSNTQMALYRSEIQGVTATDVAHSLGLERANVSKDLNKLVTEGRALKINSRPVLFFDQELFYQTFQLEKIPSVFESLEELKTYVVQKKIIKEEGFSTLVGFKGSLKEAVKKAQAAILYPPNGLTTLITGETGVGKSLFAENMYHYAKEKQIVGSKAPFIIFNCADFADNQQLLLSHLFGYKKGAFTGAEQDTLGLVDAAKDGFLFLDEVHRLSSKGQEMLFYLMDKGTYKKLGEIDKIEHANIHLIMATTEEPSNVMLNTFLRRIPVHIHLPSLHQKLWQEKLEFIYMFVQQESKRIGKMIQLPQEVLFLLLNYSFVGNIGQMKSEIQYTCAHAFIDSLSQEKDQVILQLQHLPVEIAKEYEGMELKRQEYYQLPKVIRFDGEQIQGLNQSENQEATIYIKMRRGLSQLEKESKAESSKKWLATLLTEYTQKMLQKFTLDVNGAEETVGAMFIAPDVYQLVYSILAEYFEGEKLGIYTQILAYHLTIVMKNQIQKNKLEEDSLETYFLVSGSLVIQIANEIKQQLQEKLSIKLSSFDGQVIEQLLQALLKEKNQTHIGLLVIMHGEQTASSMGKTVNDLLGIQGVTAIDMGLEEKIQQVYLRTKEQVQTLDEGNGVLILADMGSIKTFEQRLIKDLGIDVRVLDMVSTPLVLEAVQQILSRQFLLDELVESLTQSMVHHWQRNQTSTDTDGPQLRYFETIILQRLKQILIFLDPQKIYPLFKAVLMNLEHTLQIETSDEFLLKFIFHNGCMMEKILLETKKIEDKGEVSSKSQLFQQISKAYQIVEEYFGSVLPDIELQNIEDMFLYEYPSELQEELQEEPTNN